MNHPRALILASAAALAAWGGALLAGPLTPPAGPVASTFKTLSEVEPRTAINAANTPGDADSVFKITQSGSYYLTANVIGAAGKAGIEIAAGDVTVDLNGYVLAGTGAASLSGIVSSVFCRVCIRNGRIQDWGGDGVTIPSGGPYSLSDLVIRNCAGSGIDATGATNVERCYVEASGGSGFKVGLGSHVADSRAAACNLDGFVPGQDSVVENCTARANATGFRATVIGIEFRSCHADSNDTDGFRIEAARSQVIGCTANGSGFGAGVGAGIHLVNVTGCVIDGNSVAGGDTGILVENGNANLIIRNRASFNTTEFSIPAGNSVGPIVTSATIGTNNNPHANFDM